MHSKLAYLIPLAEKAGDGFLFADLSADVHGNRTTSLSKTFARYLRKLKVDQGGRVVMHSARGTVADKLRASGTQEGIIAAILGHAHPTMTARYGSGWDVKTRTAAVESIVYEGVN